MRMAKQPVMRMAGLRALMQTPQCCRTGLLFLRLDGATADAPLHGQPAPAVPSGLSMEAALRAWVQAVQLTEDEDDTVRNLHSNLSSRLCQVVSHNLLA